MSTSIITIIIVLFILFVFRRLDKSNTKIIKVKAYVERIVGRLEEYEKTWAEKVGVQEAALNELINRVETLNKGLNTKLEVLLEKEQKIRGAEGIIHETEANVSRLLQEVDQVNQGMTQVHQTASQVREIEEHSKLLKRHLEDTLDSFKEKEKQVNDSFMVKIESLKNQVQLTEKKLSDKVSNENITLMAIIKRMKETFSFSEQDNLLRLQKISKEIKEKTDDAMLESLSKVQHLNETVKSIEMTHMTNKNMMLDSFKDSVAKLETGVEDVRVKFASTMADAQKENLDKVRELHNIMEKMTEDFGTDAEKHVDEIRSLAEESKQSVQRVKTDMEQMKKLTLAEFQNGMQAMHKDLKEKESVVLKSTEEKINAFTVKLNDLLSKYKEDKKTVERTVNAKIDEFNVKAKSAMSLIDGAEKSVERGIENAVKTASSRLGEVEKKAQEMARSGYDTAQKKLEERVNLFTSNINGLLEKYKEDRKNVDTLVKAKFGEFDTRSKTVLALLENTEKQIKDAIAAAVKSTVDLKLDNLDEVLQRNVAILNETAVGAEAKMKEDYEKVVQGMMKKIKLVQTEVNGVASKFTGIENNLLQNTRDRIENLDKEYKEKLQLVERQFTEFESKVSQQTTDEISDFKKTMDGVLEGYKRSEDDLLKTTRDKVAHINVALKQFEERMGVTEVDFLSKMTEKYQSVEDNLSQKMGQYEQKIAERDKKASERGKAELEKMNTNMDKMKDLIKKHESGAKSQYAAILDSLDQTSTKLKERVDRSTQEFIHGNTEKLKKFQNELEARVKGSDDSLNRALEDAKKRMADRVSKLNDEIKTMKDSAKGELTSFLDTSESRLAGLEEKNSELSRKADDLEKSFEQSLKSYVGSFNNQVSKKIQEFSQTLKLTEKSTSVQVKEFLDSLRGDYEIAKTTFQTQSSKILTEELDKIGALQEKVTAVQGQIDFFLKQTDLFENANKMRTELKDDIQKFADYMKVIKTEKKSITDFETLVAKLDTRGRALQDEISKISAEKKKVDLVDEKVKDLAGMIKELELKLSMFKKEKDRINDLSGRFSELEQLTNKVNNNVSLFSDKEAELNRYTDVLNGIASQFTKLEKQSEGFSIRVSKFEDKAGKLEEKIDDIMKRQLELGSAEEEFKKLAERVEDIQPNLEFIDKQADRLDKLRTWANKTHTELESYLSDADEKIKLLEGLIKGISETVQVQSTRQAREKISRDVEAKSSASEGSLLIGDNKIETRVMKLHKQGMSDEDIAKMCHIPLSRVIIIIKEKE